MLVEKLKEFIRDDYLLSIALEDNEAVELDEYTNDGGNDDHDDNQQSTKFIEREKRREDMERDAENVERACRDGIVHLIGENEVVARKGAGIVKMILIDYAYNFIKSNLRQTDKVLGIPHKRLLKVGMTYEL